MSKNLVIRLMALCFMLAALFGLYLLQTTLTASAENAIKETLTITLDDTHKALRQWVAKEANSAQFWANEAQFKPEIAELLTANREKKNIVSHPAQKKLRKYFDRVIKSRDYQGYFIISPGGINLSSTRDSNIGVVSLLSDQRNILYKMFSGKTAMSLPQRSDVPLDNGSTKEAGAPTMFVGAPIKDATGKIIAALVFRINPARDFKRIIARGRTGTTGETYAFNRDSVLISDSRFTDELRKLELIGEKEQAILNVKIVNPDFNLSKGGKKGLASKTFMAGLATLGTSGVNVKGYQDYRGVYVLGAWTWDHEMQMGLTSEIDVDEAYRSLNIIKLLIKIGAILMLLLFLSFSWYCSSILQLRN